MLAKPSKDAHMLRTLFLVFLLASLAACTSRHIAEAPNLETRASVAALIPAEPEAPQTLTGRDLSRHLLEQTVTLKAFDARGRQIGLGSGFFLPKGRVVTNAHVVAGSAWVDIESVTGALLGTAAYAIGLDVDADLAVLQVTGAERDGLRVAAQLPEVGDHIVVAGAPLGLEGSVSRGIVAAYRTTRIHRMMQITAPISQGSSGGPVVNEVGELVGIVTEMIPDGQNLNFAVPLDVLLALNVATDNRLIFPPSRTLAVQDSTDQAETGKFARTFISAPVLETSQTVSGQVTSDSLHLDGSPFSVYRILGRENSRVQIDVMSSSIDVVAELISDELFDDPEGAWSDGDDDGGDGTNARIITTLPNTSNYYLLITSFDGSYGSFTVTLREQSALSRGSRSRWRFIGTTSDGRALHMDTETVQRQSDNVTILVKIQPPSILPGQNGLYDSILAHQEFDCHNSRYRLRTYAQYRDGAPVHSVRAPDLPVRWGNVVPDTIGESLMQAACAYP